jgi:hypothetical protein
MAKKQDEAKQDGPPIATTYYARTGGPGWQLMRLEVYPGGRVAESVAMEHKSRLVVRERMRVLLERVLP